MGAMVGISTARKASPLMPLKAATEKTAATRAYSRRRAVASLVRR